LFPPDGDWLLDPFVLAHASEGMPCRCRSYRTSIIDFAQTFLCRLALRTPSIIRNAPTTVQALGAHLVGTMRLEFGNRTDEWTSPASDKRLRFFAISHLRLTSPAPRAQMTMS
jgi:hypothetical protein